MNDNYNVSYTFSYSSTGHPQPDEFPDEHFTLSFDGTDCTIDVLVTKFETLLRSAGYVFKCLEVVKNGFGE